MLKESMAKMNYIVDDPHTDGDFQERDNAVENSFLINDRQKKSLWQSTTTRQKILLLDVIFTTFIVNACEGLSLSFFSRVVVEKGGTVFNSALILQTIMVTLTVGSIFFGIYQYKIGPRRLFYSGLVLTGLSQIAFGCLQYIGDIITFTALGVTFKALCGLGIAGYTVAIYTIIVPEYSGHISLIFGLLSTAFGCSRFVGPAYAGYMYELYGMAVPLVIWGAVIVFVTPFQYFPLKETTDIQEMERYDTKKFLQNASNVATLTLTFVVCGILGYIDVVLTLYLQSLGLSVPFAGLGMLALGGAMALFGPIVGYLVSLRSWATPTFIIGGSIAYSATLFIFSPGQEVAVVYIGCVLLGMIAQFILVPTFEDLLITTNGGPVTEETSMSLYSNISGIWYGFMAGGILLVPIVSSAIQSALHLSTSIMLYSLAGFLFLLTVVMIVLKVREIRNFTK